LLDKKKDKDVIDIPPNEVTEEEVKESEPVILRSCLWLTRFPLSEHNGKGKEPIRLHPHEIIEDDEWDSEIDDESLEYHHEEGDEEDRIWDEQIWEALEPKIDEVSLPQIDINDERVQAFFKRLNQFTKELEEGGIPYDGTSEWNYLGEIVA
jgi:hypothetical protein